MTLTDKEGFLKTGQKALEEYSVRVSSLRPDEDLRTVGEQPVSTAQVHAAMVAAVQDSKVRGDVQADTGGIRPPKLHLQSVHTGNKKYC